MKRKKEVQDEKRRKDKELEIREKAMEIERLKRFWVEMMLRNSISIIC